VAGFAPEVPRVLAGRYHLVRPLARGGMAEVWEGQDDVLSRPVAVKILMPHLTADPVLRERFRREAITAARLVHPCIVAVFDAGVEQGDFVGAAGGSGAPSIESTDWPAGRDAEQWCWGPSRTAFIVMELVPGQTLRDLLRERGSLPPPLALAIAGQVADALAYAHSLGLVHRDIKPANVLLRDGGSGLVQVKVADFGIAKAAAATNDLTAQGALLGTPKYVSPEQVRGEEPDARADLYSLGVVMFEMLAGEPPFSAGADMATALAHVQQPAPSLADIQPGLPAGLSDLVGALLEKDPARRIPSASALASKLRQLGRELGLPPASAGTFLDLAPAIGAASAPLGTEQRSGPRPNRFASRRRAPRAVAGALSSWPAAQVARRSLDQPEAFAADGTADLGVASRTVRKPRRLVSLTVVALVACGGVVAEMLLHQAAPAGTGAHQVGAGTEPSAAGGRGALKVVGVREVAVNGNRPNDNVAELPNVISPDSSGYWQSAQYDGPRFGNYGGLGIALQLDGTHLVHELVVTTPMEGWSAEVFVANGFSSDLSGWGRPLDPKHGVNGDCTFSFPAKRGSWVLFWMLNPGPTYRATVDKLTVR
jgi:serine/threonine protein kinase